MLRNSGATTVGEWGKACLSVDMPPPNRGALGTKAHPCWQTGGPSVQERRLAGDTPHLSDGQTLRLDCE